MSNFGYYLGTLRKQGLGAMLSQIRRAALNRAHHVFYGQRFEKFESVSTSGFVSIENLTPEDTGHLATAREYVPTPRTVIDWIVDAFVDDPRSYTFIDFGSGRGRVLLAAAGRPFRAVRGVEFSEQLHRDATANIEKYPADQLKCTDIASICADAAKFDIPDGNCVLYFYNPFGPELLEIVLSRATEAARARGDRLTVIFYNPVNRHVADGHRYLVPRAVPWPIRLKFAFFSPSPVAVYDLKPSAS